MCHIPVLDTMLKKHINESKLSSFSNEQLEGLYEAVLLVGTGFVRAREFNKRTDKILNATERTSLRGDWVNPQILLGIRGFIFDLVQRDVDLSNEQEVLDSYIKFFEKPFGIKNQRENLQILKYINSSLKPYLDTIKSYPPVLTPKQIQDICVKHLKTLDPFMKSYAYKKLRFICTSNNLDFEDIISVIREDVISICYAEAACKRGESLLKSMKNYIKQSAINLIYYYAAEKRQRLISTEAELRKQGVESENAQSCGYYSRVISTDMKAYQEDQEGDLLDTLNIDSEEPTEYEKIDFKQSYYFRMKKLQDDAKRQVALEQAHMLQSKNEEDVLYYKVAVEKEQKRVEFVNILSNQNPGFVNWYNEKKVPDIKMETVADVAEEEGSKTLEVIREYLGLTHGDLKNFLRTYKLRVDSLF